MEKLTRKQEMFVQEYCNCLNGTEAYKRVYKVTDDNVAGAAAARTLRKVKVTDRIEELRRFVSGKHNITRERLIKRLASLAFPDTRVLYDENGALRNIHDLTEEQAAVIEGMETVEEFGYDGEKRGDVRKIKMSSQKGAIDSLARMLGFNEPEKIKSEVANSFPGGVLQIVIIPPIENKNEPL